VASHSDGLIHRLFRIEALAARLGIDVPTVTCGEQMAHCRNASAALLKRSIYVDARMRTTARRSNRARARAACALHRAASESIGNPLYVRPSGSAIAGAAMFWIAVNAAKRTRPLNAVSNGDRSRGPPGGGLADYRKTHVVVSSARGAAKRHAHD
jgi:hypothetical protein